MTLQQMKYFVAVADSGSISEAAKKLFAAQSSVSEAVRAVETHYGITAFIRSPKGVTLTNEGKDLFIEFKGLLNQMYYLDLKYENKKSPRHSFYVSAQHHIWGMDAFLNLLSNMEDETYSVGFRECRTNEVFEHVEKGLSDLGIIFFAKQRKGQMIQELRSRGIIFNHISYETAHVYLWEGHPLASAEQIHIGDLIRYPFITYDRTVDANPAYTELIVPHYHLKRIISVSDRAAAYSIMRSACGFVVGTGHLAGDSNYSDILALPICDGIPLEIGWIARNNVSLSELAERFLSQLTKKSI